MYKKNIGGLINALALVIYSSSVMAADNSSSFVKLEFTVTKPFLFSHRHQVILVEEY